MYRMNFLSINRFERKKNIELAITSFSKLLTLEDNNATDVKLTIAGMSFNLYLNISFTLRIAIIYGYWSFICHNHFLDYYSAIAFLFVMSSLVYPKHFLFLFDRYIKMAH